MNKNHSPSSAQKLEFQSLFEVFIGLSRLSSTNQVNICQKFPLFGSLAADSVSSFGGEIVTQRGSFTLQRLKLYQMFDRWSLILN